MKQNSKRYSVTFDSSFGRRIDAIAHFKGLTTTQYIRMVVMDHVMLIDEISYEGEKRRRNDKKTT